MTRLKMILPVLGGSLMLLQLGPLPLMAANYYVSTTGTATWANCSGSTPLSGASACSWQTAMANAVADDIVYFRGGTYDVGPFGTQVDYPTMNPANSGTLGHPITFIAYPGEVPNITGQNNGGVDNSSYFGCGHRNYITWDGFTGTLQDFGTVAANMVGLWFSTACVITNGDFIGYDAGSNPYNVTTIEINTCTNCEVSNNRIHDMTGAGPNTTGIWIFSGIGTRIHNNNFVNDRYGVEQKLGPNNDNWIYQNFFYNLSETAIFLNNQSAGAPGVDKMFQNVMVNTNGGVDVAGAGAGTTESYEVYNNTIYSSTSKGGIGTNDHSRNTKIWNNILHGNNNPFLRYYTGVANPAYSDYNDFYHATTYVWNLNYTTNYTTIADWRTATSFDANSITSDPLFVNAGGNKPEDYKLQAASPARISGRGGAYASVMGAYITGTECIGIASNCQPPPTASIPPARPRGLRLQ